VFDIPDLVVHQITSACSSRIRSARASLFQPGWFVESLITQTLIVHVIRTNNIPSSRAARVGNSP
jgi:hypothetical protein